MGLAKGDRLAITVFFPHEYLPVVYRVAGDAGLNVNDLITELAAGELGLPTPPYVTEARERHRDALEMGLSYPQREPAPRVHMRPSWQHVVRLPRGWEHDIEEASIKAGVARSFWVVTVVGNALDGLEVPEPTGRMRRSREETSTQGRLAIA